MHDTGTISHDMIEDYDAQVGPAAEGEIDGEHGHVVRLRSFGAWKCGNYSMPGMNLPDLKLQTGSGLGNRMHIIWAENSAFTRPRSG